ncbi:MAG: hypothetical protein ACXABG_00205 [Promethearchaeota archaeon]|jgi:hypothetical protein
MAWTPPSKLIVTLTFILMAAGIFLLVELFFAPLGILPVIALGPFNPTETWGIIAMVVLFFSWFLFYLGVIMKGM